MESGSEIVNANISTEPSCELAAFFSEHIAGAVPLLLVLLRNHSQVAALWR